MYSFKYSEETNITSLLLQLYCQSVGNTEKAWCCRKEGGFTEEERLYQWNSSAWIRVSWTWKGGHPPHIYLLMSETLLLRNLLACPRNTPEDKTRCLWSEALQSTQHNVEKSVPAIPSENNRPGETSGLIRSEGLLRCFCRRDGQVNIEGESLKPVHFCKVFIQNKSNFFSFIWH